jgi:hypothetical protein
MHISKFLCRVRASSNKNQNFRIFSHFPFYSSSIASDYRFQQQRFVSNSQSVFFLHSIRFIATSSVDEHLNREKSILDARSQEMCDEAGGEGENPSCNQGNRLVIPPSRFSENLIDSADYHLNEAILHIKEANRIVEDKRSSPIVTQTPPRESSLFGVMSVFGNAFNDSVLGRATQNALSTSGPSTTSMSKNEIWLESSAIKDELERKGKTNFIAVIFEKPSTAMRQGLDCKVRVIESIDADILLNSSQTSASTRVDAEAGNNSLEDSSFSSTASFGLPPCNPSSEDVSFSTSHLSPGHPSQSIVCSATDEPLPPDARVLADPSLSLFPWPDHPMPTKLVDSPSKILPTSQSHS